MWQACAVRHLAFLNRGSCIGIDVALLPVLWVRHEPHLLGNGCAVLELSQVDTLKILDVTSILCYEV